MTTAAMPAAAPATRLGLRSAARIFARYGSPRIMAAAALLTLGVRLALGHWSLGDLYVAAGILAVEPFVEWVIHVCFLHLKPRTLLGVRVDPLFAKRHRMHHRDPRDTRLVFVPLPVLATFLALLFAIAWFAFPTRYLSVTAFATFTWFFFGYEWTHYLIHSAYVPRGALFRAVWRAHILHHYKNERYWFGVTSPVADHVLRTAPRKDRVPTSPTARTLGVDDELELIRI